MAPGIPEGRQLQSFKVTHISSPNFIINFNFNDLATSTDIKLRFWQKNVAKNIEISRGGVMWTAAGVTNQEFLHSPFPYLINTFN